MKKEILGYTVLEKAAESERSLVYRCRKEGEKETVIIKILKAEYPTPSEMARFKQEYDVIKNIRIDGVIKTYDIVDYENNIALILECFDGRSLKEILSRGAAPDIKQFLKTAIKLSEILGKIHQNDIVHKDIKPRNILVNEKTGKVRIIDFGISSVLTHANKNINSPVVINGTLPYMSPEQTGRMNRTVDFRTDIYSLGITFYEMLTGRVPFKSTDPMEVIHSHIALKPVQPRGHEPKIPPVLSDIVMKLLAKDPEDRYRNAFGLAADLAECLRQYETRGDIEAFKLGKNDVSNRFVVQHKLFGREREREALLSLFERVSRGKNEMLLVAGNPGVGKSALVNEMQKPLTAKRGFFITGKYDQYSREAPYSAIIQAFRGLVRQVLAESEEKIRVWKEGLRAALGPSGRVITDVIPDVELIIGKQGPLAELGPEESRNRFNRVFETFISLFTGKEHPLVLFLDDLQWADLASFEFIRKIVTSPGITFLFIIGAFRDTEVGAAHPLKGMIRGVEDEGTPVSWIALKPLLEKDIRDLVVYILRCGEEKGSFLAKEVFKKTQGNPFFVNQFIHTLYDEKLLKYSGVEGWGWEIEKIRKRQVTDNVVDLMIEKINRLPEGTREILVLCSCMGNRFDLETLSVLRDISLKEVVRELKEAVIEELVGMSGEEYYFCHDRIQEAAYSLIGPEERAVLHYRIGEIALSRMRKGGTGLFYTVDQLNLGAHFIKDRTELAALNLEAGKMARKSAAYSPAYKYLETGIGLLEEKCWEEQYRLTLDLYTEAAGTAYCKVDYERMERMADSVIENCRSVLDSVGVYTSKIAACIDREDFHGAISMAIPVANILGARIPERPTKARLLFEFIKARITLAGKNYDDILKLPRASDPEILGMTQLISGMGSAFYSVDPRLMALISFRTVGFALKHGNTPEHSLGYIGFGLMMILGFGDVNTGYSLAKLALRLVDSLNARGEYAKVHLTYNFLIRHWKEHLKETIPALMETYHIALETGDLQFAAYCLYAYESHSYQCGRYLPELKEDLARLGPAIAELNKNQGYDIHAVLRQVVLNLVGYGNEPTILKGKIFDEEKALPLWLRLNDRTVLGNYFFIKSQVCYIFNSYAEAMENLDRFSEYRDGVLGTAVSRSSVFYDSLTRLALYPKASKREKAASLRRVRKNQKKLKKWAEYAPMNNLHRYYLTAAELARVRGDNPAAEEAYELAMELSKQYEFFVEEALSGELAAEFYFAQGKKRIGRMYLREAYLSYARWGAIAKLQQLDERFPGLLSPAGTTDQGEGAKSLDLSTVVKAARVLSGEIVLSKLLVKIMKLVLENAGAERGVIILEEGEQLLVEAEGAVGREDITSLQSIPVETFSGLSSGIVNYAARTKKTIILNNASLEGNFISDPYVAKNKPKSVLCTPVLNQGKLTGIVYLENNLADGAFTPERIEILELLSSQVAISIDNARLYYNLEEKVRERTSKLAEAYKKLQRTLDDSSILVSDIGHKLYHELWPFAQAITLGNGYLEDVRLKGLITDQERFEFAKETLAKCEQGLDKIEKMKDKIRRNFGKRAEQVNNKIKYVLENALTHFESQFMENNIVLEKIFDFDSGKEIKINAEQIEIVLENVIDNAIEALKKGSIEKERRITVRAGTDNTDFLITVEDSGPGIPGDMEENIFGVFYSGQDGEARSNKGLGLGLHLARWIVEDCHGGRIEVESEEGTFTRFKIYLPEAGGFI
ncbi:MAG: AAA family ATPase [bacterium]|nr:AAA family ATPase [bacterium]